MRKQWKLAAIMVIDIVGYTALKPIIRKFNGEWLKEIEQRTLWSFPNVVDAVMCALKIQRSTEDDPELSFRIGIHIWLL